MDRANEQEHLRKADAGIAAARERIERQRALVARLVDDGHDASTARSILHTMHESLAAMERHRELIVEELAR